MIDCVEDAYPEFTEYYRDWEPYRKDNASRILTARDMRQNGTICGCLFVDKETEGAGIGSIGCTSVAHAWRGQGVAGNMVMLGTKYLKEIGMKEAFLSYTYSGLEKLYGRAGYRICVYYFMAQKNLFR